MALTLLRGIPIPTILPVPDAFGDLIPRPQIDIPRISQRQDAWCYAACGEMVINYTRNGHVVSQCRIASHVKGVECCTSLPNACVRSGCRKDQIKPALANFRVASTRLVTHAPLPTVVSEISDRRLIEVIIDWHGSQGSHAVLIAGVLGQKVYVIDPLKTPVYLGWRDHSNVRTGFGAGRWDMTFISIKEV